jgi:hypothetical protein
MGVGDLRTVPAGQDRHTLVPEVLLNVPGPQRLQLERNWFTTQTAETRIGTWGKGRGGEGEKE